MGKKTSDSSSLARSTGTSIAFYKDGPYLVRGEFELVGQDGGQIEAGRRVVALCRCGKSQIRPFCDGTHRSANFRASGVAEGDSLPSRPPGRPRPVARCHVTGNDGGSTREDFGGPLSQAVTWIALAHEALVTVLDGPIRAKEYLAVRVAESLVRAASALVETRRLQPPPAASPELLRDGLPGAAGLVRKACDVIAAYEGDPVLGTVYGLLCDANWELEMARCQGG